MPRVWQLLWVAAAACAAVHVRAKTFSDIGRQQEEQIEKWKNAMKDGYEEEAKLDREEELQDVRKKVKASFKKQTGRWPTTKELDDAMSQMRPVGEIVDHSEYTWPPEVMLARSRVWAAKDRASVNMTELAQSGLLHTGFAHLSRAPKKPAKLLRVWNDLIHSSGIGDEDLRLSIPAPKVIAMQYTGRVSLAAGVFRQAMAFVLEQRHVDHFHYVMKDYYKSDDPRNPANIDEL